MKLNFTKLLGVMLVLFIGAGAAFAQDADLDPNVAAEVLRTDVFLGRLDLPVKTFAYQYSLDSPQYNGLNDNLVAHVWTVKTLDPIAVDEYRIILYVKGINSSQTIYDGLYYGQRQNFDNEEELLLPGAPSYIIIDPSKELFVAFDDYGHLLPSAYTYMLGLQKGYVSQIQIAENNLAKLNANLANLNRELEKAEAEGDAKAKALRAERDAVEDELSAKIVELGQLYKENEELELKLAKQEAHIAQLEEDLAKANAKIKELEESLAYAESLKDPYLEAQYYINQKGWQGFVDSGLIISGDRVDGSTVPRLFLEAAVTFSDKTNSNGYILLSARGEFAPDASGPEGSGVFTFLASAEILEFGMEGYVGNSGYGSVIYEDTESGFQGEIRTFIAIPIRGRELTGSIEGGIAISTTESINAPYADMDLEYRPLYAPWVSLVGGLDGKQINFGDGISGYEVGGEIGLMINLGADTDPKTNGWPNNTPGEFEWSMGPVFRYSTGVDQNGDSFDYGQIMFVLELEF